MLKVFVRCVQLEAEKRTKSELLRAKLRGEVSQADYAQVNAEFDIEIAVTAHPGLIWLRAPAFHARGHGFESRGPVAARHYFETERVHPQGSAPPGFSKTRGDARPSSARSGPCSAPKQCVPIGCEFELQSWKRAAEAWI